MTMNIAVLELQAQLARQLGPLTQEQRDLIQAHPVRGHEMLQAAGVKDVDWLRAVLEHHEVRGGTGYPRKIQAPSQIAELVHMADVFCAKVAPRAHRKAIPPNQVAKELFLEEGDNGNNPIPALMIKEIGIYPPGSYVKLANGETAVVIRRGKAANTPVVSSLYVREGAPFVDQVKRDTALSEFQIVGVIPREKVTFDLNTSQIWGYSSAG